MPDNKNPESSFSNPFHSYTTAGTDLFAGRGEYVDRISDYLINVKKAKTASFLLYGERGIGKTSLARFIESMCRSGTGHASNFNFVTSYYSVEKQQTLQDTLEASLNNVTDSLPETVLSKLGGKLGDIFNNGKFSFGAFGVNAALDVSSSANKKYILKDQIISSLSNLIQSSVTEAGKNKKDGIFLIIDDIHNLKDLRGSAQLFRNIINTLDFRDRGYFSFLLISYEDDINTFFEGDPSARRSFNFMKLDVMSSQEAQNLLIKGLNQAKIGFDPAVLSKEVDVAAGYPHALQVLGHNLVEVDQDNYIDGDDWQKAVIESARELQQKDFFDFYNFTGKQTAKEKAMNILALCNGGYINKKSLSKVLGLSVYRVLSSLIKQGAVQEDPGSGQLSLQSRLLATAISFYLKTKEQTNKLYSRTESDLHKALSFSR